jgi:iron(III) transport system substrate-binding protein
MPPAKTPSDPRTRPLLAIVATALCLAGCGGGGTAGARQVVIYATIDQQYAEPVLEAYEAASGVDVQAVYDVEAAKTTGLVNRLIAEQGRPLADVWWSGEFAQTIELADRGLLAAYDSPSAADIPAQFRDPGGRWAGFGGRARVLLVNTDRLAEADYPSSVEDLAAPAGPADQVGMAHPVFGTTATHAAALYSLLGADQARAFFQQIAGGGVRILDGNGAVRDLVADGQLAWGITDTDDACGAVERGAPVAIVVPDQGEGEGGTLIVPNTVALVAGGPNPDEGRALVDYLLSRDTEKALLEANWIQLSLRGVTAEAACPLAPDVRGLDVTLPEVAAHIEEAKADMAEIFVR